MVGVRTVVDYYRPNKVTIIVYSHGIMCRVENEIEMTIPQLPPLYKTWEIALPTSHRIDAPVYRES